VDDPAGARPLTGPAGSDRAAAASDDPLPIPNALDASLVLVRHGESEMIVERRFQGRAETPLSATGRAQSERDDQLSVLSHLPADTIRPLDKDSLNSAASDDRNQSRRRPAGPRLR
jgi:hypothetical protein